MPAFSAVLITSNEERDLSRALAPLEGLADEIVVVDSSSTDRTLEIARRAGARVFTRPFTNFAEQKNFAASQAAHDWVLSLDADEVLSPELRDSLGKWKGKQPECTVYRVSRRSNYLGGWIRHSGWYPEYVARLYRRDLTGFAGALHETVVVNSRSGLLAGELLHYSIRTLSEHYAKQEVFTTRAAENLYAQGHRRWRGAMWTAAPWTFLRCLLLQLGFLDGYRGMLIAWTSARYVWLKYRKLGILVQGGKLEAQPWPQAASHTESHAGPQAGDA